MDNFININSVDPFKDIEDLNEDVGKDSVVHLRLQQRNGRKCITIVEGLKEDEKLKLKNLTKIFRKSFNCSATVINGKKDEGDKIIQLSGDKRVDIKNYLIKHKIVNEIQIKTHGY